MILYCVIAVALLTASVWDIWKLKIPLWITIPLFVFILFARFEISYLLGIIPGGLLLVLSFLSKGQIGMADAFLVISLGLAMGIWCILGVLFVALLLAGVWSAILLAFKKVGRKKLIPFAPFLLAAYGGVLLAI